MPHSRHTASAAYRLPETLVRALQGLPRRDFAFCGYERKAAKRAHTSTFCCFLKYVYPSLAVLPWLSSLPLYPTGNSPQLKVAFFCKNVNIFARFLPNQFLEIMVFSLPLACPGPSLYNKRQQTDSRAMAQEAAL
jgi:hypothetical protein